jgi:hypothetical protein
MSFKPRLTRLVYVDLQIADMPVVDGYFTCNP